MRDPQDFTIDSQNIPQGENNKLIQNVSFLFEAIDYYTSKVTLKDGQNERFSIPERIVDKSSYDM